MIKLTRWGEKRICSPERDEAYRELVHDVKMALRPWREIRKKISSRTIPDNMKPMHREAYEQLKAEIGPRLLDILHENTIKNCVMERFEQITLGAISLARAERKPAKIVTYNALSFRILRNLYEDIRKEPNPPIVSMALLKEEDPPKHFQFPRDDTDGVEYRTPFD